MPPQIVLIQGSIAEVVADAVVNAADRKLAAGSCVSGALFEAAEHEDLRKSCNTYQPMRCGDAVMTPGFSSFPKYIIHAVTPKYGDREICQASLTRLLKDAYKNSLKIAVRQGCKSIAFPILGAGSRGYPRSRACREAIEAICESEHSVDTVLIVASGTQNFKQFRRELMDFKRTPANTSPSVRKSA